VIEQLSINWSKYMFITIATYSFLRDCSIHILPTYHILSTYISFIFYLYYLCYFIIEFTFYNFKIFTVYFDKFKAFLPTNAFFIKT
jgi:hypothetical protein